MFAKCLDRLRCSNPREFFAFASCVSGIKKKVTFAQAFKSQEDENGDIVEAPSFKDYVAGLYFEDAVHNVMPFVPRCEERESW